MPIITLLIITALVVGGILLLRSRRGSSRPGSFWDVVRNPDLIPDLERIEAEIARSARSLSGSPERIAALVDSVIFPAGRRRTTESSQLREIRILHRLGREPHAHIMAILGDPKMASRLVRIESAGDKLPEAPIGRLCAILTGDISPPLDAAALLEPYLSSGHEEVREPVARVIGSIVDAETLPCLRGALTHLESDVRAAALQGLGSAIASRHIDDMTRAELFDVVASLWSEDPARADPDGAVPSILLRLDPERATARLLDHDVFTPRFKHLERILTAFDDAGLLIPRAQLIKLIERLVRKLPDERVAWRLGAALAHLGGHHDPEDLPRLEALLGHVDEDVVDGAVEALYRAHRFEERFRNPGTVLEEQGWDALTPVERMVVAVQWLDAEIRNGGFAQYFFNSWGDRWPEALAGLEAIGAERRHAVLRDALDRFGTVLDGARPSTERDARLRQLARLEESRGDPFRKEDDRWYRTKWEHVGRLLLAYDLANTDGRERAPGTPRPD